MFKGISDDFSDSEFSELDARRLSECQMNQQDALGRFCNYLELASNRQSPEVCPNAEADFFRVLRKVVGDRGHILAQVSLRQLLWFPGNNQSNPGRQIWQNKVAAKTVDFVICDVATLKPKVVIELDEPSHSRPERQTRDEQVDAILEAAGMPVVRVLTSRAYDTRELEAAIAPYLI